MQPAFQADHVFQVRRLGAKLRKAAVVVGRPLSTTIPNPGFWISFADQLLGFDGVHCAVLNVQIQLFPLMRLLIVLRNRLAASRNYDIHRSRRRGDCEIENLQISGSPWLKIWSPSCDKNRFICGKVRIAQQSQSSPACGCFLNSVSWALDFACSPTQQTLPRLNPRRVLRFRGNYILNPS